MQAPSCHLPAAHSRSTAAAAWHARAVATTACSRCRQAVQGVSSSGRCMHAAMPAVLCARNCTMRPCARSAAPHRLRRERQLHSISRPDAAMPTPSTTSRPSICRGAEGGEAGGKLSNSTLHAEQPACCICVAAACTCEPSHSTLCLCSPTHVPAAGAALASLLDQT